MTRQAHSTNFTPFSCWLRELGSQYPAYYSSQIISNQDIDFVWHNHKENWLIILEEKRFGGMRNKGAEFAQDDTHSIVAQMLQHSSGITVRNGRGKLIQVEFRGYYKVVLENDTPDNGGISINGKEATKSDLRRLLATGRLQCTPATAKLAPSGRTVANGGGVGDAPHGGWIEEGEPIYQHGGLS